MEETGNQTETPGGYPPAPKTSGLAVASLILAVLCVTAPIALILGIIALVQTSRNPQLQGRGLAIAGMIISIVGMLMLVILSAIMFPVFARAKENGQRISCINNLKQVGMALSMYAADNNGYFPQTDRWNDSLKPYKNEKYLICPSVGGSVPSYGMNDRIGGLNLGEIGMPAEMVSFFDSMPGANQAGEQELLPSPPRHLGKNNAAFVDGHAAAVENLLPHNWDPGATPGTPGEPEPQAAPGAG